MPAATVTARRRSTAGHGRTGLTWSAVTGLTPPHSPIPRPPPERKTARSANLAEMGSVGTVTKTFA